jgi:hypothetical protein
LAKEPLPAVQARRRLEELRARDAQTKKGPSSWEKYRKSIPGQIERLPRYTNLELASIHEKCAKEIVGKHNSSEVSPDIQTLYEAVVFECRKRHLSQFTKDITELLRKNAEAAFQRLMSGNNWNALSRAAAKSSIPELTDMYLKSVKAIADTSLDNKKGALTLRNSVFAEWQKRKQSGEFFSWRNVRTPSGIEKIDSIKSHDEGMLSAFGYHVGKVQGLPTEIRKLILDDIFLSELPPINGREYMQSWGYPNTSSRLRKLDRTLAMLGTNERGRGLALAPEQRQADLDYLEKEYYLPMKYKFSWTKT